MNSNQLTQIITAELVVFLATHLPNFGNNYWETHVKSHLSFHQQRMVEERGITTLEQLDLAALLRVLNHNWYELSSAISLPSEGRSLVRELQAVRNRWAHLSITPTPTEDNYRDIDTLVRVLNILGAEQNSIAIAEAAKKEALSSMANSSDTRQKLTLDPANADEPNTSPVDSKDQNVASQVKATMFEVGQLVALRSNPNVIVAIIEVMASDTEARYKVFQNGLQSMYYESQLQSTEPADKPSLLSADNLRAYLTSLYLLSPSTANLYSLRSGRVQFVSYQYRPVMRLIRADQPRLLIADEVGVGKTIEAGLIIKELRARMNISSVLIICPKALVNDRKWVVEMKRFDEDFVALDGKILRHCLRETELEGEWPDRYAQSIIPFSLFDSDLLFGKKKRSGRVSEGLLSLDPPPRFDLVIVDEAHHIRNANTYLHQAVRYFCDNSQATIFLTATPVQLGSQDLFTLLNVLRPDIVIDPPSFEQMAEPNRFINTAVRHCRTGGDNWQVEAHKCLQDAAYKTEWGRQFLRESPTFQDIYDLLQENHIDNASRIRAIRSLEELYTFSPMINRTRRRDIGEFTTRKPETLTVKFTPEQRQLHDDLLNVVSRILAHAHDDQNVNFMMSTIRRQAASCLYGLVPLFHNILNGKLDNIEAMDGSDGEGPTEAKLDPKFLAEIRNNINTLLERTRSLDPHDPKVQTFVKVLREKNQMSNNKALIFSTFRHTLAYIEKHVMDAELRYGLIHGGVPDDQRIEIRRRFALPKSNPEALDVLLSSEVGGEGLDFQFCDLLINYDLPWNPMRIEQRIGRLDRYGQQSERVAIINLLTPDTVDADIYNRCLMRIGVFHHAVGGSEEILGEISQEIKNIAENFSLTPEQRAERLQQLSDNKIRQIQEETTLEEKQAELFGLKIPNQSWREEIKESESFWLSPDALQRCVISYLSEIAETEGNFLIGEKPLKRLRLSKEIRAKLLNEFRKQQTRSTNLVIRQWEKWLKGDEPLLMVTFDQETTTTEARASYLNVLHPLVRQAAQYLQHSEAVHVSLTAESDIVPTGEYPFAIYKWRKVGIRTDDTLIVITPDPELSGTVMSLLKTAADKSATTLPDKDEIDRLEKLHYSRWHKARANHMQKNQELVQHRQQSLNTSHKSRCKLLQDQIDSATDEKIRRMKKSELARARYNYENRILELKKLAESADIHTTLVVKGMLCIT